MDGVRAAIGSRLPAPGIWRSERVEDLRPKDEAAWTAVRNHAVTIAESGNLLMMAPRAVDGDRLLVAGDNLYSACVRCHEKYMPANR